MAALAESGVVEASRAWGIRFSTSGGVVEIGPAELRVLRAELRKLAEGSPRLAVATELDWRLESLVGPLDPTVAFEPHSRERFALLRALDHLRNLGHRGGLMALRERILLGSALTPVAYRLRPAAGGPPLSFWSFSREYEAGDRLVRDSGEEFRVLRAEAGDPAVLVVEAD